ncbi:FRIGIDA-like protein 1 [Linum grandiflorum]
MEEKLTEEYFKQAEHKQGRFIGLVEDVHTKSSSMISFWKDLELQYGSVRESLRQRALQLDVQARNTEEARKRVEEQEIEVQVKMEAALGFLDKVREKESEMDFHDSELGLMKAELHAKEKILGFIQRKVDECETLLQDISKEIRGKEGEMDSLQKSLELKQKEIKNSIRKFNTQCKSNERRLATVVDEIQVKERNLSSVLNSIAENSEKLDCSNKELERVRNMITRCGCELKEKEEKLHKVENVIREGNAEQETSQKLLCSVVKELKGKKQLLEAKCGEISAKEKELSSLEKQVQEKENGLDELKRLIVVSNAEHDLKDKELTLLQEKIQFCSEELDLRGKDLDLKKRELDDTKTLVVKQQEEISLNKEQTISLKTLVEEFNAGEEMKQCSGKIESKVVALSSTETKLIELQNNLAETRKHMEERAKAVETERRELQKEVDMIKVREEKLVSNEKLIQERVAELEAREKQLRIDEQRNKMQQLETAENIVGAIVYHSTPDSLLLEPSQPNLTDVEVHEALKVSPDPAGMIFGLLKDSVSRPADETVIMSWVLILEQLVKVSPEASPEVKAAAIEVAVTWRAKLGQQVCSMDVLAFLLFVAAYGATSHFKPEDLLELVVMIADHESAVELCRSLGLVEWIPELIWRLCKKNKHMEAVRFSVAFNLVNEFQPNKLLWDHLSKARIFEDGNDLLQSQYEALNNHLDKLKALPQKVVRLGVDPSFVIEKISDHLGHLETIMGRKRSSLLAALVIMRTPMHGDYATVTGNNGRATGQSVYLTPGENQSNKRQKR